MACCAERLRLRRRSVKGQRRRGNLSFLGQGDLTFERAQHRGRGSLYCSASVLADEHEARTHDFSHKADVVHSEILLPDGAPEHWSDRSILGNAVETSEKRKDAQLAREVELQTVRDWVVRLRRCAALRA